MMPTCRSSGKSSINSRIAVPRSKQRVGLGCHGQAQDRHDTGSTTARSVDEIALIRDTINHYGPVFIASLSIQIRRAGVQKKFGRRAGARAAQRLAAKEWHTPE